MWGPKAEVSLGLKSRRHIFVYSGASTAAVGLTTKLHSNSLILRQQDEGKPRSKLQRASLWPSMNTAISKKTGLGSM